MPITIKEAQLKYKDPNTGDYVPVAAIADYSGVDVRIDGTSVMSDGIANIPVATNQTFGAVKTGQFGIGISNNGNLMTNRAQINDIKAGTNQYLPIVPDYQHRSVFYGLAKAAGDSTQSSSDNPVGTYTVDAKASIKSMLGVNVDDVQINGTSIVNDGVARVPIASWNTYGVGKADGVNYGVGQASGFLVISPADESSLKTGTHIRRPVVANNQHISTFYGLAKAAGADMASLDFTTVGEYPDTQKIAIQKMLGIYEPPFVLLNDVTVNERTCFDFTTDSDGTPYNLLSVYMEVYYPANLVTEESGYGRYLFYDNDSKYLLAETGRYNTYNLAQFKLIKLTKINNLKELCFTRSTNVGSYGNWNTKSGVDVETAGSNRGGYNFSLGNITRIAMNTNDAEPAGTRIKIWGQWAY